MKTTNTRKQSINVYFFFVIFLFIQMVHINLSNHTAISEKSQSTVEHSVVSYWYTIDLLSSLTLQVVLPNMSL